MFRLSGWLRPLETLLPQTLRACSATPAGEEQSPAAWLSKKSVRAEEEEEEEEEEEAAAAEPAAGRGGGMRRPGPLLRAAE